MSETDPQAPSGPAEPEPPTFIIGVTMAGAVSAGAYTAGVLDYLLRALDRHNARVDGHEEDRPRHRVVLKVMSGASAGGVCAALSVVGLVKNRSAEAARLADPVAFGDADDPYAHSYVFEPMHAVWVDGLHLWHPAGESGLLAIQDLRDADAPVLSLLNGDHVAETADRAIADTAWPAGAPLEGYDFLAQDLEIFLTATNLAGVPYRVSFRTGDDDNASGHTMAQHAAVRHFRVKGLGTLDVPSTWLAAWRDEGIPLELPSAGPLPVGDAGSAWQGLRNAAIATGAFPVGLAATAIASDPREFGRQPDDEAALGGAFPVDTDPTRIGAVAPDFGVAPDHGDTVRYVAVDGGLMNNEPFEYARYTLRPAEDPEVADKTGRYLKPNPRSAETADRAVIMIDPFPEGPAYLPLTEREAEDGRALVTVLGGLLPALKNQARFKPSELLLAASGDIHSRFLIAPSRDDEATEGPRRSGAEAIASGGLGGFLGFFDRRFRAHDFILGQRNCQRFLQAHFTLAPTNPVLRLRDTTSPGPRVPIVQPGAELENEIAQPPWPAMTDDELEPLLNAATRRLGLLGHRLVRQQSPGLLLRLALERIWSMQHLFAGVKVNLRALLIKAVLGQLVARKQHAPSADLSDLGARVLSALVAQGSRRATAAEIRTAVARARGPGQAPRLSEIEDALQSLVTAGQAWTQRPLLSGRARFTHRFFRPSGLAAARAWLTG